MFKGEKDKMKQLNSVNDIVKLSVSGVTEGFQVSRDVLCSVPGSNLQKLFSGEHKLKMEGDNVFLDRNPKIF